MRNFPSDRTSAVAHWNLRQAPVDLVDSSENNPPTPSQMFTRLGVMVMLALCFGLAAQVLVGMPPR